MEDKLELIKFYFSLGLSYKDMVYALSMQHRIVLSLRHLKRILKSQRLLRRKNYSHMDNVIRFVRDQLRGSGSLHGYRWMYQKCIDNGLLVRKEDIRHLLNIIDPEATAQRRSKRMIRRSYFVKGPNYMWHMDSYDKLKPFGICINGCIDGFARKVIWLKAYNTSSDPRVVAGYFIEAVLEFDGCPRIIRSDKGTENGTVCQFQRFFRRDDQVAFAGERSFLYGKSTSNQRIERWWGFLRNECAEFWISLFHKLRDEGYFDGDFVDKNLIIFCFLGLIQDDLDATADVWDNHTIRPSRNDKVPHGRPNVMYTIPELFQTRDYKCVVPCYESEACKGSCTFRSSVACDEDIFMLCSLLMAQQNLLVPKDAYQALDLYLELRRFLGLLL